MSDFDKAVEFIKNHDFAIVVFNKDAKELYERICRKYNGTYLPYGDAIGYRFDFYEYVGYSEHPMRCYGIANGVGYFEGHEYAVLSFDKRRVAKVV